MGFKKVKQSIEEGSETVIEEYESHFRDALSELDVDAKNELLYEIVSDSKEKRSSMLVKATSLDDGTEVFFHAPDSASHGIPKSTVYYILRERRKARYRNMVIEKVD